MPHLSPMNWIIAIIVFYGLLGVFMSTIWWQQTPIFPTLKVSSSSSKDNKWNWS